MHILVTGGAGFIGSHLVDRLLGDGHEVTVVDNFDPFYAVAEKEQNVAAHRENPRYRLVRVNVVDHERLQEISGTFDAVVHLAARAGVRPSIADPAGYQQFNVIGTQNLLEFARQRKIRQFVFASSSSVYGTNPNVPWREDDAVLKPISPYASTKVSGELLGHVYSHLFGIRFIGLRFFTVYGPRQRPDLAIRKFMSLMREGRAIEMYGDGETRRDYTFVGDVVSGIVAAIHYQASDFEIINLGNNRTVSLRELISALEVVVGRPAVIERSPEQPGDVPQTWADAEKAGRLLGFRPQTELKDGLRAMFEWHRTRATPAG